MDWDEGEVHKNAKTERSYHPATLIEQILPNEITRLVEVSFVFSVFMTRIGTGVCLFVFYFALSYERRQSLGKSEENSRVKEHFSFSFGA